MKYMITLVLLVGIISCKDEATNKEAKKEVKTIPEKLIAPQAFYTLINELEFNQKLLEKQGIQSYKAEYFLLDPSKQKYKESYSALNAKAGEIHFYILQNKNKQVDTILRELVVKNTAANKVYQRFVKTTDGKKNTFEIAENFNSEGLLTERKRINKTTQRTDIEKCTYTNGLLTKKDLVGLATELYTYDHLGNVSSYLLRKLNMDTTRYAVQTNNVKTTEVKFLKGGADKFIYHYTKDTLNSIDWMGNDKLLVKFEFTYQPNGFPKTRIIKSSLKAFPSSRTEYSYN